MTQRAPTRSLSLVHWGFFLFFLMAACGTAYFALLGPPVVIAFASLSILYMLLNGRIMWNPILAAYTVVGLTYLVLSFYRLLPNVPDGHFAANYIIRTGYFVGVIYPLTAAFYLFWQRASAAGAQAKVALLAVVVQLVGFAALYLLLSRGSNFITQVQENFFYGFWNHYVFFIWGASYLAFVKRSATFLIVCLIATFGGGSMQMLVAGALIIAMYFVPFPVLLSKLSSWAIVIGFPLIAVIMVSLGAHVGGGGDSNILSRFVWWSSTLKSIVATYGIGGGFGADGVPSVNRAFLAQHNLDALPVIAVHNEFIYAFFATGLVGGTLMLLFFFQDLLPKPIGEQRLRAHCAFMFAMLVLSMSVDNALLSPTYIVGVCWLFGYLLASNTQSAKQQEALEMPSGDSLMAVEAYGSHAPHAP